MLRKIEAANERVNRAVTAVICGATFVVITFLMSFEAVRRTIFATVTLGAMELNEILMAWLVFTAFAYALITGYHVRVTLVLDRLPRRGRFWCEIFTSVIGVVFFALLLYGAVPHFWKSWLIKETVFAPAGILLPMWFAKLSMVVGGSLILVAFLIRLIRTLHPTREVIKKVIEEERVTGV